MWVTITIEPEDIKAGVRRDQCYCPIAIASNRVLRNVRVGDEEFSVGESPELCDELMTGRTYYELPRLARDFVRAFDGPPYSWRKTEPFSFKVNVKKEFVLDVGQTA